MKKIILTVDNDFVKTHLIDKESLQLFKDMPIEIVTCVMLDQVKMELEKKKLKDKNVSDKDKVTFIENYMKTNGLLSMFALANAVEDIKIEDID